jgi:hypothetical protein
LLGAAPEMIQVELSEAIAVDAVGTHGVTPSAEPPTYVEQWVRGEHDPTWHTGVALGVEREGVNQGAHLRYLAPAVIRAVVAIDHCAVLEVMHPKPAWDWKWKALERRPSRVVVPPGRRVIGIIDRRALRHVGLPQARERLGHRVADSAREIRARGRLGTTEDQARRHAEEGRREPSELHAGEG